MIVSPADGRTYRKGADAKADWKAGRDFIHEPSGKRCSVRDLPKGEPVEFTQNGKTIAVLY